MSTGIYVGKMGCTTGTWKITDADRYLHFLNKFLTLRHIINFQT